MAHSDLAYSMRSLLSIMFKRKGRIALVTLVAMLCAVILVLLLPRKYESQATLLVKPGRAYVYTPEAVTPAADLSRYQPNEVVNSEVQILNSRDLKERVIRRLGAASLYPWLVPDEESLIGSWTAQAQRAKAAARNFLNSFGRKGSSASRGAARAETPEERAMREFEKDFHVETVKDSNVIHAYYRNEDPEVAAAALGLMVKFFVEKHVEVYKNERVSFLEDQLVEYGRRLRNSEAALQQYRESHTLLNIDEQVRLLLEQRKDLDGALKNTVKRLGEVGEELASLDKEMAKVPQNIALFNDADTDPEGGARERLLALKLEEEKYTEDSPAAAEVRKQIEEVSRFLAEQEKAPLGSVRKGKNPVFEELETRKHLLTTELEPLRAQRAIGERQLAEIDAELAELNGHQSMLRQLRRQVEVDEQTYKTYLEKEDEARVTEALDREKLTNISTVQQPTVPTRGLGLSRTMQVLPAGVLGFLAAAGLCVMAEFRRGVFMNPEDIERRLGVRVLLTVPHNRRLARFAH